MPEPSLRYEIVSIHGEMRNSRTEYILGRNSRSESRDCHGYCDGDPNQPGAVTRYKYGPLRAYIQNRDLHYCFQLDLEAGVYTASRVSKYGSPKWYNRKPTRPQPSGRTVHVHTHTIDTGERREMYGYTARHVIARTTHKYDSSPAEMEVDGWYIDSPAAWLTLHPPQRGHVILASNGQFDTPIFTEDGPRETGFPVLLTRTHRSRSTDAEGKVRDHNLVGREEITEFSEEDLQYDLFVPPRDFRRVLQLPGYSPLPFGLRMRLGWERFKDAVAAKR